MPVLINFKICDNAKECGGIAECPTGALYWDKKKKKIGIDNAKCIACKKCVSACPVEAIFVAKDAKEYKSIEKEINSDPRKRSDPFIDRYGAQPIYEAFLIQENNFPKEVLATERIMAIEFFQEESIMCLLKSIPIKDLLKEYPIEYRKLETGKDLLEKYKIKKLPALLFFKKGKLLGKVEGFYSNTEVDKLKKKIKAVFKK